MCAYLRDSIGLYGRIKELCIEHSDAHNLIVCALPSFSAYNVDMMIEWLLFHPEIAWWSFLYTDLHPYMDYFCCCCHMDHEYFEMLLFGRAEVPKNYILKLCLNFQTDRRVRALLFHYLLVDCRFWYGHLFVEPPWHAKLFVSFLPLHKIQLLTWKIECRNLNYTDNLASFQESLHLTYQIICL